MRPLFSCLGAVDRYLDKAKLREYGILKQNPAQRCARPAPLVFLCRGKGQLFVRAAVHLLLI